jgi:hypothetical protein
LAQAALQMARNFVPDQVLIQHFLALLQRVVAVVDRIRLRQLLENATAAMAVRAVVAHTVTTQPQTALAGQEIRLAQAQFKDIAAALIPD